MPDISMCKNKNCELKENCYRYRAIPSEYMQSYAEFENTKEKECEYYQPLKEGDRIVTIDKIK